LGFSTCDLIHVGCPPFEFYKNLQLLVTMPRVTSSSRAVFISAATG
jgi:hypothetical protein